MQNVFRTTISIPPVGDLNYHTRKEFKIFHLQM